MTSDLSLYFAGIFLSFTLQVAAGYIACSLLSRVLTRPRQRFAVWMTFLAASGVYWVALAAWSARVVFHPLIGGNQMPAGAVGSSPLAISYLVPFAWSRSVLLASKVVFAVYVVVVALLMFSFLWRRLRLRLVLRHARPASPSLRPLLEMACRDLRISRCDLVILPGIASPATVGWLRPKILLPSVCEEIGPTRRLADVLQHELVHVARRDYLWAGLSELLCHMLFFHPAVWRAQKRLFFERELACDSAVVETHPDRRADYADSLAFFVRLRMLEEKAGVGLDFAASASTLGKRVRFVLAGPPSLPWWKRASRAVAALAVMGVFAVVLPAITVFLAFAKPLSAAIPSQPQAVAKRPAVRKLRHDPVTGTAPVQKISRIQALDAVSQSESSTFANGDAPAGSDDRGDLDRPWRERNSSLNHPSVSDVVRDTVTIMRPGPDRDHDHERNGRLGH
jgi:beta-lactamase regulating signal transducer with metallopeptidase domain